eukprot:946911-Rhodomonas_salina.9
MGVRAARADATPACTAVDNSSINNSINNNSTPPPLPTKTFLFEKQQRSILWIQVAHKRESRGRDGHGEGFAAARLAVGEDAHVEPVDGRLH